MRNKKIALTGALAALLIGAAGLVSGIKIGSNRGYDKATERLQTTIREIGEQSRYEDFEGQRWARGYCTGLSYAVDELKRKPE